MWSAKKGNYKTIDRISITLILLSAVFSNIIYGFLGGVENTFSTLVVLWLLVYFLFNIERLNVNVNLLIFCLFISLAFIVSLADIDYSDVYLLGLMHGVQICIKLSIISIVFALLGRLNYFDFEHIIFKFSLIVFYVTIISLPIHFLSLLGYDLTRERFISMDEAGSLRFGGFGFETLDYAYCAMISSFVIYHYKLSLKYKLFILFVLGLGLFFTKSNFITIALAAAILYAVAKKFYSIRIAFWGLIFLSVSILIIFIGLQDFNFLNYLFLRSAAVEEGTSLGERILPGINLLKFYFENYGYLKFPSPGISVAEAIAHSEDYITFNAWGLAKILTDFGFIGLFLLFFIFRSSSKIISSGRNLAVYDWIFAVSLVYIFAQAGYLNFTAITFLILSYKMSVARFNTKTLHVRDIEVLPKK